MTKAKQPLKQMKKLSKNLYWADKNFVYQGLWLWTGKKNIRVVPTNRFTNWGGKA